MFFFHRAFNSFFLGSAVFAVLSMLVWWLNYPIADFQFSQVPAIFWHGHEMVFGYALATIAGFLLTAAMNWNQSNFASGKPLILVFVLWSLARLGFILDWPIIWVAALDMAFTTGLFLLFFIPNYVNKNWKQMGLASKFLLLMMANAAFYAEAFGALENGYYLGMVAGLFLVLAINLTMMRRLIPFFTARAFQLEELKTSKVLDVAAVVGFFALMIAVLIDPLHWSGTVIAIPLTLVHLIRFYHWYHPKIWGVALLWPLYLSYAFMILGMALYGFVGVGLLNESFAIHALAAGGIGLLCSAILARISLGHTQRNVFEPPKMVVAVFAILTLTAVVRVLLPMAFPDSYVLWMHLSQFGWVLAFVLLVVTYWSILTRPNQKHVDDLGMTLRTSLKPKRPINVK